MSHEQLIVASESQNAIDGPAAIEPQPLIPLPQLPIAVRAGTMADLPFIDRLQKANHRQVGFFPRAAIEGKIRLGHVLIAEQMRKSECETRNKQSAGDDSSISHSAFRDSHSAPLGYLIGNDQYFKRDDVGIIFQLNVEQTARRGLIGATLLKAQFERSAYGCRLYCCWCAQDIEANKFWEAMGFVPLAFRSGSRTKGRDASGKAAPRVHIFWQKRIRSGDVETPFWFPSQTSSGTIREDRLVLPIPPGLAWSDAMPVLLPQNVPIEPERKRLPGKRTRKPKVVFAEAEVAAGGLRFDWADTAGQTAEQSGTAIVKSSRQETSERGQCEHSNGDRGNSERAPRVKPKNNPAMVAAARELRDRWLEEVNAGQYSPALAGKYDICRVIEAKPRRQKATIKRQHALAA